MYKFSTLLKDLPTLHEYRMSATGYAVWLVWSGELTEAIPSTFRDYGGVEINADQNQAVWYFWSRDVFQAAARLQIWANLNDLPVFIQIMPTNLMIGFQGEMALSIASELFSQQAMPPEVFEVWVHPKVRPDVENTPGIHLEKVDRQLTGMASAHWHRLSGDPRIGFRSSLAWYFILRPLGNPLDKRFIEGWPRFFAEVEQIIKHLKLKFILHDNHLIFELENFKTLTVWCREILALVARAKDCEDCAYWPCVMAAVEKAGFQFNEDLPRKVALDWDKMAPDFPHMSYRTAFLLGPRFRIKDVSYSFERNKLTDWCYVMLAESEGTQERGSLNVALPVALLVGSGRPCFYCGQRTHGEAQCPSRRLVDLNPGLWRELAGMNLEDVSSALVELGEALREDPAQALGTVLTGSGRPRTLLGAVFEINAPSQLRMAPLVMRALGKDLPSGLSRLSPPQDSPHAQALGAFLAGDAAAADAQARQGALRAPRDFGFRTLQGFLALERGDLERAVEFWAEAEHLGDTPLHFAYHKYLQGRALEVQGRFDQAMALYRDAYKLCPRWNEPLYRQAVSMVKMGFTEHAVSLVDQLVDEDPNMFNRVLVDPEMERGYVQLLGVLYGLWVQSQAAARESAEKLRQLQEEIDDWFGASHEFGQTARRQIEELLHLADVENFVVFRRLAAGRVQLEKAMRQKIEAETRGLTRQAENIRDRLRRIHEDISWFPFPRALRDFNRDFNFCVAKLNWVRQQHFTVAKNFRQSHEYFRQVEDILGRLGRRLVTLRIVRDATLFVLLLSKSFMWLEIIGLGLALVAMPASVFMAEHWGIEWISRAVEGQRWSIQKGLVVVVSVAAFVFALLRTALVFEKKKARFFEEQVELGRKLAQEQAAARGRGGRGAPAGRRGR